jgi:ribulose-bisphosphate carboxylase small chain
MYSENLWGLAIIFGNLRVKHLMFNGLMKLTQGCFSFLPDLNQEQLASQIQYAIDNSWAVSIEYTDDPHPRNSYWSLWGLPLFDVQDPAAVLFEIKECCKEHVNHYVKVSAFDNTRGTESCVCSFIVHRPSFEPGFRLVRQEVEGRRMVYTVEAYATVAKPEDERYSV